MAKTIYEYQRIFTNISLIGIETKFKIKLWIIEILLTSKYGKLQFQGISNIRKNILYVIFSLKMNIIPKGRKLTNIVKSIDLCDQTDKLN